MLVHSAIFFAETTVSAALPSTAMRVTVPGTNMLLVFVELHTKHVCSSLAFTASFGQGCSPIPRVVIVFSVSTGLIGLPHTSVQEQLFPFSATPTSAALFYLSGTQVVSTIIVPI